VERFATEDARQVMRTFGITSSRRATTTDSTEEVFLLSASDFAATDIDALTRALMEILPHTKVFVVEVMPRWTSEPL
jgi:hypothetical protein